MRIGIALVGIGLWPVVPTAFDGTLTIGAGKPQHILLRRKKSCWGGRWRFVPPTVRP